MAHWKAIAIDSGGTFTDVISVKENEVKVFKVPSTPDSPNKAIETAISSFDSAAEVIHGTTVATNAILERKGAKVVLVTTKGFKDVLEIGRQNRNDIYALYPSRPEPLVPRERRLEVQERINAEGDAIIALGDEEVKRIVQKVTDQKPDSIAICTLFSFLNGTHELKLEEELRKVAPVSRSSLVHPEYREYERTSTTVIDAYVKPIMSNYLSRLTNFIQNWNQHTMFSVMKSDMGLAMSQSLLQRPVESIFSGLAGGVQAAIYVSELIERQNLLTIDIGGTSTDVAAIIGGKAKLQQEQKIDELPVSIPAVDVITIGAGGGSLVRLDVSGLVKVGPESAGADPGPVAYNMGGKEVTVTDVDLVAGILPQQLAGGIKKLDKGLAEKAVDKISDKMGMDLNTSIKGIRTIFHENIASAVRNVSTQRGYDPRNFTLLAFGGAGPVHAAEIAEIMKIPSIVIPPFPGVWSSMGLLGADFQYNERRGVISKLEALDQEYLEDIFEELKARAISKSVDDGHDPKSIVSVERTVNLRFVGQSFDLEVPYNSPRSARKAFLESHEQKYGFAGDDPIELVACAVRLVYSHESVNLPAFRGGTVAEAASTRTVLDYGKVDVFNKKDIPTGMNLDGPLIIEQDDSTIWIPEGWQIKIDTFGFILGHKI